MRSATFFAVALLSFVMNVAAFPQSYDGDSLYARDYEFEARGIDEPVQFYRRGMGICGDRNFISMLTSGAECAQQRGQGFEIGSEFGTLCLDMADAKSRIYARAKGVCYLQRQEEHVVPARYMPSSTPTQYKPSSKPTRPGFKQSYSH
ncbi:hypothetical protein AX17_005455 [Amanita inopinata Kibby_2008]|nr:hypothetical protein AX17_005455 [Amanita inopinata Kibby_2008]